MQTNSEPGAIFRFVPEDIPHQISYKSSLHQVGLIEVLSLTEFAGKRPQTVIIGVPPEELRECDLELTPTIQMKIPEVIEVVSSELRRLGIVVSPIREA